MNLDGLIGALLTILAHVGLALAILLFGRILARIVRGFVRRLLERPGSKGPLGPSMVTLLSGAVYYLVLALAIGLSVIVLGVSPTYVATATVVLLVVFAVALQQSLANFAAAIIFLLFEPFRVNEQILTMGYKGKVRELLFFNTVIELPDNRLVSLPNSKVQDSGVVNYTRLEVLREDILVTITYDVDLARVRSVLNEIAATDKRILVEPPFEVNVDDLGENGVRLKVQAWVAAADFGDVSAPLREKIKTRFDAEKIPFAFPKRDIHLTTAAPQLDGLDAAPSTKQEQDESSASPHRRA